MYDATRLSIDVCLAHAPQSVVIVRFVSDETAANGHDDGEAGQDEGMGAETGDTDQGQDSEGNPTQDA